MRRIFRKTASFVLAVISVLSLTACHGVTEQKVFEAPTEFDETKPVEIVFWAKNDTNVTQTKIYEKAIEDFQKLYPNVTVNMRLYSDYKVIYNDVITNISTDTTPNVCITYPDHIATYLMGADTMAPLNDLINNEKYGLGGSALKFDSPKKSEVISRYLEECAFSGIYYGLPYMRSTEACYINKTYVEKLGYEIPETLTWDFIWEVSDAAVSKKNADGTFALNNQKVLIPFIYKSTDNMMIQMLKQMNAGYSDENGDILIFNDTTKGILQDIAEHVKKASFSTFAISGYPGNFINAGQCLFGIDSTAGATWMGSDAPLIDIHKDQVVDFETVVKPVPQADPDNPWMISQGPSICLFNKKDSNEVMASWMFMQFLLTDDVQIDYSKTEGYVPVTQKARDNERYKDYLAREGENNTEFYDVKIKAAKLLLENTDRTFTTPVFNGSTSLRSAAGQLIENVTKSVRRKEKIDDAYYDKLYKDITSLYRLDGGNAVSVTGKKDLGDLPPVSILLIVVLCVIWAFIVTYFIVGMIKKSKEKNQD